MSNTKLRILVTGATGLVGSRFVQLYRDKFDITTIGRSNCDIIFDILNFNRLLEYLSKFPLNAIVNFAAYTNVDGAETEKGNQDGDVYKLNVLLPYYLAKACSKRNSYLCHISTDYVFDGRKKSNPYTEEEIPSPVDSWYSQTKYEGELKVAKAYSDKNLYSIVRISYPFNGLHNRKFDIARLVVDKLQNGTEYLAIIDQKIKPANTNDIANAISLLIFSQANGIFHIAGKYPNGFISPYKFALSIAKIFSLNSSLIKPVKFIDFSKTRIAPRPQHTWLNTNKIEALGVKFSSFEDALINFRKQLISLH